MGVVVVLVVVLVVVTKENKVNPRFCLRLWLGFDKNCISPTQWKEQVTWAKPPSLPQGLDIWVLYYCHIYSNYCLRYTSVFLSIQIVNYCYILCVDKSGISVLMLSWTRLKNLTYILQTLMYVFYVLFRWIIVLSLHIKTTKIGVQNYQIWVKLWIWLS